MDAGLAYALVTAASWAGVAAGYNAAARRGLSMTPFVAVAASIGALLCALFTSHWSAWPGWREAAPLVAVIGASGVIGQTCMLVNGAAMRAAPERSATTWTVTQMAMVIPFLAAVISGREHALWYNWSALPVILLAAFLILPPEGQKKVGSSFSYRGWLELLAVGFVLSGVSQALAQEISLRGWQDTVNLRAALGLGSGGALLWLVAIVRRQYPTLRHWLFGGLTGLMAAAGNVALYKSLDACAARGNAYMVFPVTVAGSILLFAVYQMVTGNEPCPARKILGLACGVIGVVLLGLR